LIVCSLEPYKDLILDDLMHERIIEIYVDRCYHVRCLLLVLFPVRRAKKTVSRIITEVSGSASNSLGSVSQRGRRRSAKKYWKIEENADPRDAAEAAGEIADSALIEGVKDHVTVEAGEAGENDDATCGKLGVNGYFEFELLPIHTAKNRLGRKMFQCDVCSGVYRHCFSLKRHYLRNHINRRYISRVDALNCNITFCEPDEKKSTAVSNGAKPDKRDDEVNVENGGTDEPRDSSPRIKSESGRNELDEKEKQEEIVTTLQMDVEEIGVNEVTEPTKPVIGRKKSTAGTMHLPGLFRCYVCEKLFDKVNLLKAHFSECHATGADKRFACRHCQMQFKHRQNLVRHEVVHSGTCWSHQI
jgi:hypothetical protein